MSVAPPPDLPGKQDEDARLESLGYTPQLNRVLGFFANFAVAFTYLSPMVGIYSLSCSVSARVARPTSG
jgi:hypothetical protein